MTSWARLNEQIAACRRSANPLAGLEALFAETNDGHVAMALGEVHRSQGDREEAIHWFRVAEKLYPRAEFKSRARGARSALESSPQRSSRPASSPNQPVLHVVSCSRTKVWERDGTEQRYVPAVRAYRGADMLQWLHNPESRTARWLVLSAKYGFIEPDHPIADYDVTFKDPATGPVTADALRAQVRGQARWAEKVPLASFTDVVVHGGSDYVNACRVAFEGIARVRTAGESAVDAPSALPRRLLRPAPGRSASLASVFRRIPEAVYAAIDRREPEWQVLERLAHASHSGTVTALALALTDYQLGQGGAPAYWREIAHLLDASGLPGSNDDVLSLVRQLVKRPVSSRLADRKVERVEKLLNSKLSDWAARTDIVALGGQTDRLWGELASAMRQAPNDKTIAFAMKTFDLLHCVVTGAYTMAGEHAPIVADLRIARVSFSSGLLETPKGLSVLEAMERAEQMLQDDREPFLAVWAQARDEGRLNLFRVDSLLWQFAEVIYQRRGSSGDAQRHIVDVLTEAGCSASLSAQVALELTWALS